MKYLDAMARATRRTAKYRGYAALYDMVVATLPPRPTVLEIGIANGGSLQTWRSLLGADARIIGVDLNPGAAVLEQEGFEVLVLDTGLEASWHALRARLGRSVHLLVDDGGHTNRQQISALIHGVDLVVDGGWIVIEDLHASFMDEFGNPSGYSTARFIGSLIDDLHRRHPRSDVKPRHPNLASAVDHVVAGTSWVGLRIDRRREGADDEIVAGDDDTLMDYDHRWDSSPWRHFRGRAAERIGNVIRNRYTAPLVSFGDRRLFHRDAGNDGPAAGRESARPQPADQVGKLPSPGGPGGEDTDAHGAAQDK